MPRRAATKATRNRTFIREWRKFRKHTQEKLADMVDMSAANLSRIEKGEQDYTQSVLEAIATALRVDASALLSRRPNEGDDIWPIWEAADAVQRAQIAEIAKTITRQR